MKKLLIKIIGQTFSIGIFVSIFLFSLFITYGYRYDFDEGNVIQTSVIDVCSVPEKANLYLDNELYSNKSCQKILGLEIGSHNLEIRKNGYYTWSKNIFLDKVKISYFPQVFLIPTPEFYLNTIIEEGVDNVWLSPNQSKYAVYKDNIDVIKVFSVSRSTTVILEAPAKIEDITWIDNSRLVADSNVGRYEVNIKNGEWKLSEQVVFRPTQQKSNLIIDKNELWMKIKNKNIFITRYSKPIQSAQYFFNDYNLLIATDDDIRICDYEGENCHIITTKDLGTPIAHPARSKKIIYVKNNTLQQIILNDPSGIYTEMNL